MKKSHLSHMIFTFLICTNAQAEQNPFKKPLKVWETQLEGFDMKVQRKYIPEYTRNRYGEREIIGISRIDLRLVNIGNQYRCGQLTIKDNDRPKLQFNNYTKTGVLLKPNEQKNIGYIEPEDTEELNINYNFKKLTVVNNNGMYSCEESKSSTQPLKEYEDCYITTAMCRDTGKLDNCEELQTLRHYRDEIMLKEKAGQKLVDEYYLKAPKIVSKINQEKNHKEIYTNLRELYIEPAAQAARLGQNEKALVLYKSMVEMLEKTYL